MKKNRTSTGVPVSTLYRHLPGGRGGEIGTEDALLGLRRAGLIRWSGKRLKPISPVAKAHGEKGVADLIIEDRG